MRGPLVSRRRPQTRYRQPAGSHPSPQGRHSTGSRAGSRSGSSARHRDPGRLARSRSSSPRLTFPVLLPQPAKLSISPNTGARPRACTHTHTHTQTHTHTHTHTHTDVFCAFPALEGGRFARTPTEGEETEGESGRAGGRATSERQPRAGTRGARQAGAGAREVGPRGVAVPSSPPRCAPLGAGLRPEP